MDKRIFATARAGLLALLATFAGAHAQDRGKDILIGHTYPASDFLAGTGAQMKSGIDSAIAEANAAGGIRGRPLRVLSLDDAFSEERAVANARKLVSQDEVAALLCPVGTGQVDKLKAFAEEARVPIVGAKAGPDFLRGYSRYLFFTHASFGDEVEFLARQLATLGIRRVSVAYITLPFGKDLLERFGKAAAQRGITVEKTVAFNVHEDESPVAAHQLAEAQSQAYLLIGAGKTVAHFARHLVGRGVKPSAVYGVSVVPAQELIGQLGPDSSGIVLMQVMPSINTAKLPIVRQYLAAARKYATDAPSQSGLEGYLGGRLLVEALKRVKGPITREALAASMEALGRFDLGGFTVHYNGESHHGARFVDMAIISNGQLRY